MPATYTYNDALDDAKKVVAKTIGDTVERLPASLAEPNLKLMLSIIGQLDSLKRPQRQKRSKPAEIV